MKPVEFTNKDGVRIGGLLTLPPGVTTASKLPFVLHIHGGPNGQDTYGFMFDREWIAANGYAVLQVNYRGSHGRGQAFQSAIFGDWGNKEVMDLLAGVDWAIKEGIADPARLGIGGWSYGGILTNYTIASDPRFKGAVSGAGSSLQLTMYGTDQYIVQYETEMGQPWKTMDRWMKVSYPFFKVEQIKTPTMFMAGEKDFNVPAIGSEQMYQALKSVGTPTRLVIYPGQFHGITRPSYRRHRLEQWVQWFDTYVKGAPAPRRASRRPTASEAARWPRESPRAVPAARGLHWAREGLEFFAAAPAVWIGITLLFMLMGVVLSIIPFAGMLWSVVVPIHAGGLMLGLPGDAAGPAPRGPPPVQRLRGATAAATRPRRRAVPGGQHRVMLPVIAHRRRGDAVLGVRAGQHRRQCRRPVPASACSAWSIVLLTMAVGMVLSLALWFAPALVVFDDVEALDALKSSLRAGWANVGAFLVYGLVLARRRTRRRHRRSSPRSCWSRRAAKQARPDGRRRHRRHRLLRAAVHPAADTRDVGRDVRQLRRRVRPIGRANRSPDRRQADAAVPALSLFPSLSCQLRSMARRVAGSMTSEAMSRHTARPAVTTAGTRRTSAASERHAAEQGGVDDVDGRQHRPPAVRVRRDRVWIVPRAEPQVQTQRGGDRGEAHQRESATVSPAAGSVVATSQPGHNSPT